MAAFVTWIKKAVQTAVDPQRDERQKALANKLGRALVAERRNFSLERFTTTCDFFTADLEAAKGIVLRKLIDRAWTDGSVSEAERGELSIYAKLLRVPPDEAIAAYHEAAMSRFADAFAVAMEDGKLDQAEIARLGVITASVGMDVRRFVRTYFQKEGAAFLGGVFDACTHGGALISDAWERLSRVAGQLGFDEDELVEAIQGQSKQFIEHVLADEEIDHRLTENDVACLKAFIARLRFPSKFADYVARQLDALERISRAARGHLIPVAAPQGLSIRAGEIVYYLASARWIRTRMRKEGPVLDEHSGMLVLTDNRLIFVSSTAGFDTKLSNIVGHWGRAGGFRIQMAGKPEAKFQYDEERPVGYAILEAVIGLANQTLVLRSTSNSTRHIPRDVRQRVWQRCGGRCMDCNAADYLEFDHIVPVAKGGSNSDQNVQLLCRRCNLRKSDAI